MFNFVCNKQRKDLQMTFYCLSCGKCLPPQIASFYYDKENEKIGS